MEEKKYTAIQKVAVLSIAMLVGSNSECIPRSGCPDY